MSPEVFSLKQENCRSLPLFWRLLAIIMVCWFALLSVTLTVTLRYSLRTLREQIDSILLSTVVTLGNNPDVRQTVEQGRIDTGLADYLTDVIVNTECLEYITIADQNSIRIYHICKAARLPASWCRIRRRTFPCSHCRSSGRSILSPPQAPVFWYRTRRRTCRCSHCRS